LSAEKDPFSEADSMAGVKTYEEEFEKEVSQVRNQYDRSDNNYADIVSYFLKEIFRDTNFTPTDDTILVFTELASLCNKEGCLNEIVFLPNSNLYDKQDRGTLLHLCIYFGYYAGIILLLDMGIDMKIATSDGFYPLHYAQMYCKDSVYLRIKMILDHYRKK